MDPYEQVTRRIIRHHKKLFRDDVEHLCLFITDSCEALNCMLSEAYRREKAGVEQENVKAAATEEDDDEGESKGNGPDLEEKKSEKERESEVSVTASVTSSEMMVQDRER
jgi:hypothetical protein